MRKIFDKIKLNKGFSLAEVLVALAVSSVVILIIVAFITQGTRFFNRQSTSINLQNEMQELSDIIVDSLQEADYLQLKNVASGVTFRILTGRTDPDTGKFVQPGKGTERDIIWSSDNPLYIYDVVNGDGISDTDKEGYAYSKHVSFMRLSIDDSCKLSTGGYSQPLILNLEIKLTDNKESRSSTRIIKLRNVIEGMKLGDLEYIKGENNILSVQETS